VADGTDRIARLVEDVQRSVKQLQTDSGSFLDYVRAA
jgi:hypothetical protein